MTYTETDIKKARIVEKLRKEDDYEIDEQRKALIYDNLKNNLDTEEHYKHYCEYFKEIPYEEFEERFLDMFLEDWEDEQVELVSEDNLEQNELLGEIQHFIEEIDEKDTDELIDFDFEDFSRKVYEIDYYYDYCREYLSNLYYEDTLFDNTEYDSYHRRLYLKLPEIQNIFDYFKDYEFDDK